MRALTAAKILVVDSDPDILRVVRFYLSKDGFMLVPASSNKEALEILQTEKEPVELILCDTSSKSDGVNFVNSVHNVQTYRHVPIVIMSTLREAAIKVDLLRAGAVDYIDKPFNFEELKARITNHIAGYRRQLGIAPEGKLIRSPIGEEQWDIFISHAYEDKEAIARPLAEGLRQKQLKIWFDEFTLKLGDSLRRSIDYGLKKSRYGVVVISPNFLKKEWPQRELNGLFAKEAPVSNHILPVWHNVTANEIREYSPILADRVAVSTDRGIATVISEIIRAVT